MSQNGEQEHESTEQGYKEFLGKDAWDSCPFVCLFNAFFIEYPRESGSVLGPRGEDETT